MGNDEPPTDLTEVPVEQLAEIIRSAQEQRKAVMLRAAEAVAEMRRRGMSWRQIKTMTGVSMVNVRRWVDWYLPKD